MARKVYKDLARVLDALPNGFPAAKSGVELKILEKIFTPEEARLFCDMRLSYETAAQVAGRTGRPLNGLEEKLRTMAGKGQLFEVRVGGSSLFKMIPFVIGIYGIRLKCMDVEMTAMLEEYLPVLAERLLLEKPQLVRVLPVEEAVPCAQDTPSYEKISTFLENGQSFRVSQCICRKEREQLGKACGKPGEVCMAIAPLPGYFEQWPGERTLSRDEARALLKEAEEAGLVHITGNVRSGHYYICNCCGCCCGMLRAIRELGMPAEAVINSSHYAVIDPGKCTGCGICAGERCQADALVEEDGVYRVARERCIGCGLCVGVCPEDAIRLVRKDDTDITPPPATEDDWFEERGRTRGVDFSAYK